MVWPLAEPLQGIGRLPAPRGGAWTAPFGAPADAPAPDTGIEVPRALLQAYVAAADSDNQLGCGTYLLADILHVDPALSTSPDGEQDEP